MLILSLSINNSDNVENMWSFPFSMTLDKIHFRLAHLEH